MQLDISSKNISLNKRLRDKFRGRIKSVFGQTQQAINSVSVSLADVNGPKGGKDKQCHIKLTLAGLPAVFVMVRDDNIYKAFTKALQTANLTLKRRVKKHKMFQRHHLYDAFAPA